MNNFYWYLIIINAIGFILFLVNTLLYSWFDGERTVDPLLTVVAIIGGSVGIILSMLIFDRRFVKANMMSRVFVVSISIVQIVLFLFYNERRPIGQLDLNFLVFFKKHYIFFYYLIGLNLTTFVAFGIDKLNAIKGRYRIPNFYLITLMFFGGTVGAYAAMRLFRHKIQKDYYMVGVKLIAAMHIIVVFYLMNTKLFS